MTSAAVTITAIFTGRDWKDADNYDLCLDSATLGWEKCMQIVKAYLEIKMS